MINMPVFDPFTNIGTSQVFYQLMKGRKNPKSIADALGVQSPPIIQQLRRLQKIEVVRLGGKEGKFQNYEVDWNNFLTLFVDRAMQERESALREKIKEGEIPMSHAHDFENRDQIKRLKDNQYFKRLILLYLQNVAKSKPSSRNTISHAVDNFENALRQSKSFENTKKFEDPEKQDFFDKMRLWHRRTSQAETWMDLNLHGALRKILRKG